MTPICQRLGTQLEVGVVGGGVEVEGWSEERPENVISDLSICMRGEPVHPVTSAMFSQEPLGYGD